MFRTAYFWLLIPVLCGLGFQSPPASAGWVCIKNESKLVLIIREISDRPLLRRGKVVKLLPGEVYREHQSVAGERRVEVYDVFNSVKPLKATKLTWSDRGDTTYKLDIVEKSVRLAPVVPAKSPSPPVVQAGTGKPADPPKR